MKTLTGLIMMLLIWGVTEGFTQNSQPEQFLDQATKTYLWSLGSENHGVRNSTILCIVQFKKRYPEIDFGSFVKKLQKISQTDPYLPNRMHAQLAIICLEQTDIMASVDPNQFEDPKMFFNVIYEKLSGQRFVLK